MYPANAYNIRQANDDDWASLDRLAELDSQRGLSGPALVAEIGGDPAAAISLTDGRVIADPFQQTAVARQLLHMRVRGLQAHSRTPSLTERIRKAMAPFRARTSDL
jgi:hypothetical protein